MTAASLAKGAYAQTTRSTSTPRGAEAQVLSQVTALLEKGARERAERYPAFIEALNRNLKFWMIVATDVSNDANPLPRELRAQLFYLFEFTQAHTNRILQGERDLSVDILLELNRNIITGLKMSEGEQEL